MRSSPVHAKFYIVKVVTPTIQTDPGTGGSGRLMMWWSTKMEARMKREACEIT